MNKNEQKWTKLKKKQIQRQSSTQIPYKFSYKCHTNPFSNPQKPISMPHKPIQFKFKFIQIEEIYSNFIQIIFKFHSSLLLLSLTFIIRLNFIFK